MRSSLAIANFVWQLQLQSVSKLNHRPQSLAGASETQRGLHANLEIASYQG